MGTTGGRRRAPARLAAAMVLGGCLIGCGGEGGQATSTPADPGTVTAPTSASGSSGSSGSPGSPTAAPSSEESPGATSGAVTGPTTVGPGPAGATGPGAPVPWETDGLRGQSLPAKAPSAPSGPANLSILLDDGFGVRTTWTLTCAPTGGTHPTPAVACGVLGARGSSSLPAPAPGQACTQQYGGPQKAKITGTWRGRKVSSELSLEDGCQIARWTALLGLLPPGGVAG